MPKEKKIYSKYKILITPKPTKKCLKESQEIIKSGDYKLMPKDNLKEKIRNILRFWGVNEVTLKNKR